MTSLLEELVGGPGEGGPPDWRRRLADRMPRYEPRSRLARFLVGDPLFALGGIVLLALAVVTVPLAEGHPESGGAKAILRIFQGLTIGIGPLLLVGALVFRTPPRGPHASWRRLPIRPTEPLLVVVLSLFAAAALLAAGQTAFLLRHGLAAELAPAAGLEAFLAATTKLGFVAAVVGVARAWGRRGLATVCGVVAILFAGPGLVSQVTPTPTSHPAEQLTAILAAALPVLFIAWLFLSRPRGPLEIPLLALLALSLLFAARLVPPRVATDLGLRLADPPTAAELAECARAAEHRRLAVCIPLAYEGLAEDENARTLRLDLVLRTPAGETTEVFAPGEVFPPPRTASTVYPVEIPDESWLGSTATLDLRAHVRIETRRQLAVRDRGGLRPVAEVSVTVERGPEEGYLIAELAPTADLLFTAREPPTDTVLLLHQRHPEAGRLPSRVAQRHWRGLTSLFGVGPRLSRGRFDVAIGGTSGSVGIELVGLEEVAPGDVELVAARLVGVPLPESSAVGLPP